MFVKRVSQTFLSQYQPTDLRCRYAQWQYDREWLRLSWEREAEDQRARGEAGRSNCCCGERGARIEGRGAWEAVGRSGELSQKQGLREQRDETVLLVSER